MGASVRADHRRRRRNRGRRARNAARGRLAASRREAGERLLADALEIARAEGVAADSRLVETAKPGQQSAAAFVEEAASWGADLVVLGARGHSAVERLLLGSVAEGVGRCPSVPVLVVH